MPQVTGRIRYAFAIAVLASVYVAAARAGLMMDAVGGFATLVWPPSGLGLAALLIFGKRLWPGILIGAFAANLLTGAPVLAALGIAAGNTLEAVLAVYALRRIPEFEIALERVVDVIGLIVLAAGLSTMVAATIGVTSLYLGGIVSLAKYGETWRAWWLGDLIGDLLVAPLILVWATGPRLLVTRRRLLEASALGMSVIAASLLIFAGAPGRGTGIFAQAYMFFPLLIWAALRFGQRGAVSTAFIVSAIAVAGTAMGHGPFVGPVLHESLYALQTFVGVAAATLLVTGASISERRRAEEEMRLAHARAAQRQSRQGGFFGGDESRAAHPAERDIRIRGVDVTGRGRIADRQAAPIADADSNQRAAFVVPRRGCAQLRPNRGRTTPRRHSDDTRSRGGGDTRSHSPARSAKKGACLLV